MASLSLKHINKVYPNGFEAVKDFNLEIADKEFIIFVGLSGCGKSTTLRMIAGLEYHCDISVLWLYVIYYFVADHKLTGRNVFQTSDHTKCCRFTTS